MESGSWLRDDRVERFILATACDAPGWYPFERLASMHLPQGHGHPH